MAVGLIGTLDLSIITDRLVSMLQTCYDAWPRWTDNLGPITKFDTSISGSMPESVRNNAGCQLTLYLLHVAESAHLKNQAVMGRPQTTPFQPLSLELFYLLSAFSKENYLQEQRALSIAMRCFNENPIVGMTVTLDGTPVDQEFVLSLQPENADAISRVWQSFSAPARLSALYKASVVFVSPQRDVDPVAPPMERIVLASDPTTLPFTAAGQVIGTTSTVSYFAPDATTGDEPRTYDLSPATAGPGQTFLLFGAGLSQPTSAHVFLVDPSGAETDVTSWIVVGESTETRLRLLVPTTGFPAAGVYALRVGGGTVRSNTTAVSIAAAVDVPAAPPSVLTPAAGLYTLTGRGFVPGSTAVILGTIELAAAAGAPDPGEFEVDASGDAIRFRVPAGLAPGRYDVRIRVSEIESAPAWWVDVP